MAGDSSDNIPGVPGIGIKTAAELINKYKNLETLLKKADEIPQKKRKETLIQNKKLALISKKLVTLKDDVPVKEQIEEFSIKEVKKEKLYKFLREMEFNRLLSQAISFYGEPDNKTEIKLIKKNKIDVNKYETIVTEKQLENWINILKDKKLISVDTETSSINPIDADLVGISFCYEEGKACYIPLKNKDQKCLNPETVLKKIKPLLLSLIHI